MSYTQIHPPVASEQINQYFLSTTHTSPSELKTKAIYSVTDEARPLFPQAAPSSRSLASLQTSMHRSTIIAPTTSPIHANFNLDNRTQPIFMPFIPQFAPPICLLPPAVAALFTAVTAPPHPLPAPPAALKLLNSLAAVAPLPMAVHARHGH
jgi:hypothetical protein